MSRAIYPEELRLDYTDYTPQKSQIWTWQSTHALGDAHSPALYDVTPLY